MIIHIILDPEQMEVVFMTPSKVAFSKHIAGLRDEMIEDDMIEEDGDYSDADLLEMYGNWYYDSYNTDLSEGWEEGNR
jgi:hypothetical protein